MKLDNFRLLRISAQRGSPFCYEDSKKMVRTLLPAEEMCNVLESLGDTQVLVAQQQQVSAAMKRSITRNSNNSNSNNSNSNNRNSNNSSSKTSSSSSGTKGASAASAEDAAAAAVAARTLFMTHVPVALSIARLQRFLEELTGGCSIERTQEKSRSAAGAAGGATIVRLLSFVFESPAAVAAVLAFARPLAAAAARSSHDSAAAAAAAATSEAAAVSLQPRSSSSSSYRPFVSMRVARLQQWIGEAATFVKTPEALQREVNQFMMEYDLKKQVERQQLKQRQQTDEEGFTLVTSEGATATDGTTFRSVRRREAAGAAVEAAAAAGVKGGEKAENLFFQQQATAGRYVAGTGFMSEVSKRNKRRRGGTEDNFYRFQLREKKRKEFAERLQSVAEEEKVVAAMEKAGKLSVF